METILVFALSVFTGFFAIMNPIANTPIFMDLIADADNEEKKKMAKVSTTTAFFIVTGFIVFGKYIFELFGLTIPAFKLAGGILIFFVGLEMLQSKKSTIQGQKQINFDESIAISPLAIPILAGPGTIVTAMNYAIGVNYFHILVIILVFAVMIFLNYLAFAYSGRLVKIIGNNKITVLGKLMGLILAVIGTGMVIDGIKLAFKIAGTS